MHDGLLNLPRHEALVAHFLVVSRLPQLGLVHGGGVEGQVLTLGVGDDADQATLFLIERGRDLAEEGFHGDFGQNR